MMIRKPIRIALLLACIPFVHCQNAPINIVYSYGVDGKNILDTAEGTFTRDMVIGPSVTINLTLTDKERKAVLAEAYAVRFFELPSQIVPPDTKKGCFRTPCSSNHLRISMNSKGHAARWDNCNCNPSAERDRADKVGDLIRKIIESKEEYKKLPEPRGAYI